MQNAEAQPQWEWFAMSNVIAITVFLASTYYLMTFWIENTRIHTPAYAFRCVSALGNDA